MFKKVIVGVAALALIATASFTATRAFFSDTEVSTGNAFTAGSLDLKVGIDSNSSRGDLPVRNLDNYNNYALFNFSGLMPGDSDSGFFKLESTQDAWACMAADIEEEDKYMQDHIEFATWVENTADGKVGTTEADGGTLTAATLRKLTSSGWIPVQDKSVNGTPLKANDQYEQGFAYCFGSFERDGYGNLVVENNLPVCNGSTVPNNAQGGIVKGGIHFYAEQARNNPDFKCSSLNVVTEELEKGGNTYFRVTETGSLGFNVGVGAGNWPDVTEVTEVRVQLFKGNDLLVTNYVSETKPGTANVIAAVEANSNVSSPFRNTLSGSTSWNYGPSVDWEDNNKPTKAVITVVHSKGTWVGEISGFTGDYDVIK